jgi:arsenate reductase
MTEAQKTVTSILFVCVHNSGRSQMAEAFLNRLSTGIVTATSAGTIPAGEINPTVAEVMMEKGIDISLNRPNLITQEMVDEANKIITMGCSIEESCPAVFIPTEDWDLEDPQGKPLENVRDIRDQIETKVRALVLSLGLEIAPLI